jgi:hypothetical protein
MLIVSCSWCSHAEARLSAQSLFCSTCMSSSSFDSVRHLKLACVGVEEESDAVVVSVAVMRSIGEWLWKERIVA